MLKSSEVKQAAAEEGFDACGIARAAALPDEEYPLERWLASGRNAGLDYMARNADMRRDPRLLVPEAKSVICVVRGYNPSRLMQGGVRIARYAYGDDYHEVIRAGLHRLQSRLGIGGKVCCDTVPISDKLWAARAGLGWIGRHTLLVTPDWGSWVNIGEIVTPEGCDCYDRPSESPCKGCGLCVAACPNGALAESGVPMVDVRRCAAYHTIESREESIPDEVETSGYAFGCDICQLACPYNRMPGLKTRDVPLHRMHTIEGLAEADEEGFRQAVRHSSMSRVKYRQWKRNISKNQ